MTFSTLTFLLVFFPTLLAIYFVIPKKFMPARNAVLLVYSLFFYAWGEPKNVILIAVCICLSFLLSFAVHKRNKFAFILSLLVNLVPLALFKYADFVILNINNATGAGISSLGLTLPIGISFYTFQVLTYIIDLYWGEVELQKNPAYLTLYIFFFPQLIAGPIVRYSDVEREIRVRQTTRDDLAEGLQRFIIGLAKKMLIANQAGYVVSVIRAQAVSDTGAAMLWVSVIAYGVQIYFDFSGYSDMAIGLGRIFGFHFLENFNKPYVSRSITDFWRRWHISLSTFFRDYVYIPLGGSRVSPARHIFNLFMVWALTGLWHGAFWNYVLWGLYYFVLLVLERYCYGKLLGKAPAVVSRIITFFFYMFGWAIFMFESNSLSEIGNYLGSLLGLIPSTATSSLRALGIQGGVVAVTAGLILSMMSVPKRVSALEQKTAWKMLRYAGLICLFAASIFFIVGESFNPFIYFRF